VADKVRRELYGLSWREGDRRSLKKIGRGTIHFFEDNEKNSYISHRKILIAPLRFPCLITPSDFSSCSLEDAALKYQSLI
jgi:hypothetical protein